MLARVVDRQPATEHGEGRSALRRASAPRCAAPSTPRANPETTIAPTPASSRPNHARSRGRRGWRRGRRPPRRPGRAADLAGDSRAPAAAARAGERRRVTRRRAGEQPGLEAARRPTSSRRARARARRAERAPPRGRAPGARARRDGRAPAPAYPGVEREPARRQAAARGTRVGGERDSQLAVGRLDSGHERRRLLTEPRDGSGRRELPPGPDRRKIRILCRRFGLRAWWRCRRGAGAREEGEMNGTIRARAAIALVLLAVAGGCASSRPTTDTGAQLAFGVEMARRGLWAEALFRFEKVREAEPQDVRALNNLAVSYEAVGRFDDALAAYREAVAAAPDNRPLKQNYSRFVEFYQAFKPKKAAAAPAPPAVESPAGAADPTPAGGGACPGPQAPGLRPARPGRRGRAPGGRRSASCACRCARGSTSRGARRSPRRPSWWSAGRARARARATRRSTSSASSSAIW